jgi:NADPH2:quinone reductase
MLDAGMIQPTVFDKKYEGLSSIPSAMNDLAARKIWGKAVILLGHGGQSHL